MMESCKSLERRFMLGDCIKYRLVTGFKVFKKVAFG